MRRGLLGSTVIVLLLAASASAGVPRAGSLVPGRSLGGIRLGESAQDVKTALGSFYGTCRGCPHRTWYFTYEPFDRRGLAVELSRGRVSGVYTIWHPAGWHGPRGLRLGATPLAVHRLAGTLHTITCASYDALVRDSFGARTVYYVFEGRLWGFGLFRRGASPCR